MGPPLARFASPQAFRADLASRRTAPAGEGGGDCRHGRAWHRAWKSSLGRRGLEDVLSQPVSSQAHADSSRSEPGRPVLSKPAPGTNPRPVHSPGWTWWPYAKHAGRSRKDIGWDAVSAGPGGATPSFAPYKLNATHRAAPRAVLHSTGCGPTRFHPSGTLPRATTR
ncbi:hypothetical protein BC628DRAFT_163876 [Trametes gibbosa]|nr:hypothetical protein BC628DRAFT_163876 [Trametes gibbosa]